MSEVVYTWLNIWVNAKDIFPFISLKCISIYKKHIIVSCLIMYVDDTYNNYSTKDRKAENKLTQLQGFYILYEVIEY